MIKLAHCLSLFIMMLLADIAHAQTWPTKPVRFIVGIGAGGSDDFHVRVLAPRLADIFGQQFVVDNRPGSGGVLAQIATLNAPADGHTLLLAGQSFAIRRFFDANMQFDPARAFAHTAMFTKQSQVLVLHPSLNAASVTEFINLARSRPGKFTIGELGGAGLLTVSSILFRAATKIDLVPVRYKDFNPLLVDLIAGRIDCFFGTVLITAPHIAAGRMRALGVTGTARSALLPDLPTIAEAGLPNFEASSWLHIAAHAATPPNVLESLNTAVAKIIAIPDVRASLIRKGGTEPTTDTREGLAKRMAAAVERFERVTKELGIKPQ